MIYDEKLEREVDKAGVVHSRKKPGETVFLEGYGTTNNGISALDEINPIDLEVFAKRKHFFLKLTLAAGSLATAGLLLWKNKEIIASGVNTLYKFALLYTDRS